MKPEELEELAAQMEERFAKVLASGYKKSLPKGMDRTSADVTHV